MSESTDRPPPQSFFAARRPAAGDATVVLQLGDLVLELSGLGPDLRGTLERRYAPYTAARVSDSGALRVRVGLEDRDYFIAPTGKPELVQVRIACDGDRIRYMSHRVAGWFDSLGGSGELLLSAGDWEPPERAVENYVRAAVAWRAAARGGALVHAAGAVWEGRAYLFYGESGAGKSTLAACNRRARVVSDDLSLLIPNNDGRLELIGSPFRGTFEGGAPVLGRFPLAAGFRLIQDSEAKVVQVPRPRAVAELVGNLPFVAEAFSSRPDLFARIERGFRGFPLAHLHFRKDDSYWDAIREAGF